QRRQEDALRGERLAIRGGFLGAHGDAVVRAVRVALDFVLEQEGRCRAAHGAEGIGFPAARLACRAEKRAPAAFVLAPREGGELEPLAARLCVDGGARVGNESASVVALVVAAEVEAVGIRTTGGVVRSLGEHLRAAEHGRVGLYGVAAFVRAQSCAGMDGAARAWGFVRLTAGRKGAGREQRERENHTRSWRLVPAPSGEAAGEGRKVVRRVHA